MVCRRPADLLRDGYVVIKGAVPRERALQYSDEIQEWLESFNLGYKRDDPSTIKEECLPIINPKGLLMAYGAPHEVRLRQQLLGVLADTYTRVTRCFCSLLHGPFARSLV
jgi:hypothetical protein